MIKNVSFVLLVLACALSGFWLGKYQQRLVQKERRLAHEKAVQEALSYTDPFAELSDEELVKTCTINGYSCSELVAKANEEKWEPFKESDELDHLMNQNAFYDDYYLKGYLLKDGRVVHYNRGSHLVLCGENPCKIESELEVGVTTDSGYGKEVPDEDFGFVTVMYPDGRSLKFNPKGELVGIEKKEIKKCEINGHSCNAIAKALNDPANNISSEELFGVEKGNEICYHSDPIFDQASIAYKLPDGTLVTHQTSPGGVHPFNDTRGFVTIFKSNGDCFQFDTKGHPHSVNCHAGEE